MSVTKTIEISASSNKSFEDAMNEGIRRTTKNLHNVCCASIEKKNPSPSITDRSKNFMSL